MRGVNEQQHSNMTFPLKYGINLSFHLYCHYFVQRQKMEESLVCKSTVSSQSGSFSFEGNLNLAFY